MSNSRSQGRRALRIANRLSPAAIVERLEARTMLSATVIDPSADIGLYYDNSSVSSSTLLIDGATVNNHDSHGIAVNLNGVAGLNAISLANVTASGNGETGIIISLKNMTLDSLTINTALFNSNGDPGISLVFDNVTINSLTLIDVSTNNNGGAGLLITSNNSTIGQISITETSSTTNIGNGMTFQMTGGSINQFELSDNATISNNFGAGVVFNLNNAPIGNLLIERNNIRMNAAGDGLRLQFNDSAVAGAINDNTIVDNAGNGVNFAPTATSDLAIDFGNLALDRRITGNTISGNTGHGVVSTLTRYMDLHAQLGGNTISANGGFGWYTSANRDATVDVEFGNTLLDDTSNTFFANRDAGIGFDLTDDVTGQVLMNDVTATNSVDGANPAFNGEGIKIKIARRVHLGSVIVDRSTVSGNASNGVAIEMVETTKIDNLTISNSNIFSNLNGISLNRTGPADLFATLDRNDVHNNAADGLNVFVTNRKTAILEFDLFDNQFRDNGSDGVSFDTRADSISLVFARRNNFDGNGAHGLFMTTHQDSAIGDPGDSRTGQPLITSLFENNTFNFNGLDGMHSVANNNSRQLLRFDSPIDVNATSGTELNVNGDDGYSFESFGTAVVTVAIRGTDAMLNDDDAIVIFTGDQSAGNFLIGGTDPADINNLGGVTPYDGNGGDGIDISINGGSVNSLGSYLDLTVVGNHVQYNGEDAVKLRVNGNSLANFFFDDNLLRFSGSQGVDAVLTGFVGDRVNEGGREVGGVGFLFTENTITDNALEGIKFETNSGVNQQFQVRLPNTGAPSNNLLPAYDPRDVQFFGSQRGNSLNQQRYDGEDYPWLNMFTDIVTRLTVTNNLIRDNGNLVDSHGVFINVGTNSYVAADVQSNVFGGNVLSDFHTDSFVSAGNPNNAVNNTGVGTFDFVTLDDSAQLDLRFALNTGDHIAVDAIGALYTNNDPGKQNGLNGNETGPAFTRGFSATNRRADIFRIDNAPGLNYPNNDFRQFGIQQDVRFGTGGFQPNGYVEVGFADPLFPSYGFPSDQTVAIADLSITEGNVGSKTASFAVSLSQPATETVTVTYAVTNNTATANVDFTPTSGTLVFNPGETTKNIDVTILGDTLDEYDEQFHVMLLSSINAVIIRDLGIGTILDDDASPLISVSDAASVIEGDSGTTNAVFTISLSKTSAKTITANYAAAFGTALFDVDYIGTTGSLTFNPGETSKLVSVPVKGDLNDEFDESFALYLSDIVNADIGDDVGEVTILDDDAPPSITITDVVVPPAQDFATVPAQVTVNLSRASGKTVTVNYQTADGTAVQGSDYTFKTGTLVFNPGETSKTVTVNVAGNTLNEFDENFFVNLSSAVNAVIIDPQGKVDVQGDTISINGTSVADTVDFSVDGQVHVTVNGTTADYDLNRFRRYLLDGMAGNDAITIHGTSANESAQIDPGHMTWTGVNLFVDATSFSTVEVFGGGGVDSAVMNDTVGDDSFTSYVYEATLTGSGVTHKVRDFANVSVLSYAGGYDTANLFDTAGSDRFIGRDTRSNMTGSNYNHSVSRFDRVNAYAFLSGFDLAYIYGSSGDDRLVSRPDRASMRGPGYEYLVTSFETTYAFAKPGGNDTALMLDSAGDDVYFGTPVTGILRGAAYHTQAFDFNLLEVQMSTGNDQAKVVDVANLDTVFGSGNLFELTRSFQKDRLTGFDTIEAVAKTGNTPTANVLAVDYAFIETGTWL
ncbi:MAG: Calx-beta domain-containing protein [Planctomycetaceae bacterium]